MTTKRFSTAVIAALIVAASAMLAPPDAMAQGTSGGLVGKLDHMVCRRVNDPVKLQFVADFFAELQPEFSAKGCQILKKAVRFCAPASKLNVKPTPPEVVDGTVLTTDFLMYKVKCEGQGKPPRKLVVDQFGSRMMVMGGVTEVMVPAIKRNPPCGPVGRRQCGGECPTGEQCIPRPDDSGCECVPPPAPCGRDAAGVCGGECTDPAETCQVNAVGECLCGPRVEPCGLINGAAICNGACPTGQHCKTFQTTSGLVTCDCVQ